MARPTLPRTPSQHIEQLGKALRQVEVDDSIPTARKSRIVKQLGGLIGEFRSLLERAQEPRRKAG